MIAPTMFELDATGKSVPPDGPRAATDALMEAIDSCPTEALSAVVAATDQPI